VKHLLIALSLAVCTTATSALGLAQDSAHFDISSADLTALENTISQSHAVFAIVSDANMPKKEPIAYYVPAKDSDAKKPTIWIGDSHSKMLDVSYTPTPEEHQALFTALVIMGMNISPAGSKWHTLYTDLQRVGDVAIAGKLVPQLDQDGFKFQPGTLLSDNDPEVQGLLTAVARELTPGVAGVTPDLQPASALPPYDPLAHYVGWNANPKFPNQGYITINKDYVAAHGRSVTTDPQMLQAYLEAFVLATCDSGHAGAAWKKRYDLASAADNALPTSVGDRYQNRHALAQPIATKLKALMVFE
jgi:hypothetical protein